MGHAALTQAVVTDCNVLISNVLQSQSTKRLTRSHIRLGAVTNLLIFHFLADHHGTRGSSSPLIEATQLTAPATQSLIRAVPLRIFVNLRRKVQQVLMGRTSLTITIPMNIFGIHLPVAHSGIRELSYSLERAWHT